VAGDRYPESAKLASRVSGVWRTRTRDISSDCSTKTGPDVYINNRRDNIKKGIKKKTKMKRKKGVGEAQRMRK
jgi:hypothetical protein